MESIEELRLRTFAERVLEAAGMTGEDATVAADSMVWADLRGKSGPGTVGRLTAFVKRTKAGGTRPRGELATVREKPSLAVMDAQHLAGQVALTRGMHLAIAKARDSGVGVVSVRQSESGASLGYYPDLAVREGFIGMAITNAPAIMPPTGGTTKVLGNQATGIGCPAGRHHPLLYDAATSAMSLGAIEGRHARHEEIPPGVALNAKGEPTTDAGEAVGGMLLPMAGHRGYGLALMWEVLTGVLSGGEQFGASVFKPAGFEHPMNVSAFLLAIDPRVSMPYDEFTARIDALIDQIKASPPAAGVKEVFAPGEQGYRTAERRRREGIPLSETQIAKLKAIGDEVGVPWDKSKS